MRFPHESRRSTPEPERPPRVRFATLPPSTPFCKFSVIEWTPASGLLAHLYPKRATSLQRLDNNASMVSTEEERRDPRDRVIFETGAGTWTCFRQISCCGDVLVLEDAETIDVGPPRRNEYTWQQGPGRLPSVENSNTSFGASGGWRQTLASVSQSVAEMDADAAKHGTLVSRPSRHRREIALQDIHSIRRHCFKRPVPLTFNSSGRLAESSAPDAQRGSRSKASHRSSSGGDDLEGLSWRYELWGPVGVVFMLRGGARLFLVFASGHHAEQMEELLIDFASGRGLQRRQQQQRPSLSRAIGQSPGSQAPPAASNASFAGNHGVASPSSPGVLTSPAASYGSLRLASCEASFQGAPGSPSLAPMASLTLPEAAATASGASMVSAASPRLLSPVRQPQPQQQQQQLLSSFAKASHGPVVNSSIAAPVTPVATAVANSSLVPSASAAVSLKPPASGYLYCRPWGEAARHRRYYVKCITGAQAASLARLSRHKLPAWQKIRQTLGQEPRSVAIDLRQTFVTPSSSHMTVFRVESVVDSYAQYKDVVPLGGDVATEGPTGEEASAKAARRREMELCRHRPVIFEALAKSTAERESWLVYLRGRGATVLQPESTNAPHMPSVSATVSISGGQAAVAAKFRPLGHPLLPPSPRPDSASAREAVGADSMGRWVSVCNNPSSSLDFSPTGDSSASHGRPPQLPLKESDSEARLSVATAAAAAAASSRSKLPPTSPVHHPPLSFSTAGGRGESASSFSPDPVVQVSAVPPPRTDGSGHNEGEGNARRSQDFDENGVVVEDDERDPTAEVRRLLEESEALRAEQEAVEVNSPSSVQQDGPSFLAYTVKPSGERVTQHHTAEQPLPTAAEGGGQGVRSPLSGNITSRPSPYRLRLQLSNEEATTTEPTVTGTGQTVADQPARTPLYIEDTSSSSGDEDNPHFVSPTVPNTAVASTTSPSLTPSAPSPSTLQQKDESAVGAGDERRTSEGDTVMRSRPASPSAPATPKEATPYETQIRENGSATYRNGDLRLTRSAEVCVTDLPPSIAVVLEGIASGGYSVSDPSMLRRSATDTLLPSARPDTDVYFSAVRNGHSTPRRAGRIHGTPFSSSVKETRAPTAASTISRSASQPATAEESEARKHKDTPSSQANGSRHAQLTSPRSGSSPDAPGDATPPNALRANQPTTAAAATAPSGASPVGKALFQSPRRDEGPPHAATALSSSLASSGVRVDSPPLPSLPSQNGGGAHSTSYPNTPKRRLDPRLSQLFTPGPRSGNGAAHGLKAEHSFGSKPVFSPSTSYHLTSNSGSYGDESGQRAAGGAWRSARGSSLPPVLPPPQRGSLMSSRRMEVSADAALSLPMRRHGSERGWSPLLNSASGRATHRDGEHLGGSALSSSGREVVEQRRRAFRDSLYVNHDEARRRSAKHSASHFPMEQCR